MKRLLIHLIIAATFFIAAIVRADDADLLTGKWAVKKVNDDGLNITQTIEVKKDKFVFQMLGPTGQLLAHAEGDIHLEKLESFKVARFSHMRAGESASNLDNVDEEYVSIYSLDGDTWTLASNLDKQRDQKPSLDVYRRVKSAAEAKTLIIDEIQMTETPQSATWYLCFEAKVEGVSRRYYVENKGYDKNQVVIPISLEAAKVKPGQKCSFRLQLDDVDGDACGEEADNSSTGEFTVTERGAQTYRPEDHWQYTVRWHLK